VIFSLDSFRRLARMLLSIPPEYPRAAGSLGSEQAASIESDFRVDKIGPKTSSATSGKRSE
jgi:hypothetical protein